MRVILVLFSISVICVYGRPGERRDFCMLDKDNGPCDALAVQFFYNKVTGSCEEFFYGGCGGNANRFKTKRDCEYACMEIPSPKCDARKNEVYSTCGTACPVTCENFHEQPMPCTQQCVIGCFCKGDLIRRSDGQCVLPKDC